jgi:3-phenylpropionate/cinnamic acid dioxygenase small subunit
MIEDVRQLLFHEAHLLDTGLYQEWLKLLAPDLRYWAPVRAVVARSDEGETEASRLPLFDETKASLGLRISRLETGLAWVDLPHTRTRRFISNITAEAGAGDLIRVRSNFLLFRSRSFAEDWFVVGCREDRWLRSASWLLKERKIILDHCTVENMPLFL